jgi:hypothetical protein
MPFEKGNTLGAKNRLWERTVRRVIHQSPDKLRAAAEKLIDMAAEGDLGAIKELADRLDGKSTQRVEKRVQFKHFIGDASELSTKLSAALDRRKASEKPSVQ